MRESHFVGSQICLGQEKKQRTLFLFNNLLVLNNNKTLTHWKLCDMGNGS